MWKPQLGRRARLLLCLSVVSALAVGGGIAWAAVPDSSGVITGCYDARGQGDLRIVDAADACKSNETRLTWNQQGQPGAPGVAGAQGATGATGETGPQGPAGAGVASFDDLDGTTCRVGEPQQGVLDITYGAEGAVTLTCIPTALQPLTVTLAGEGSGTVTSTPAGIDCGTDCTESYAWGASVELHATPATGSLFGGWSGACTGTDTCTVAVQDVRTVTATFHPAMTLRVEVRNTGNFGIGSYGTNQVTGPDDFRCTRQGHGMTTCTTTVAIGVPVTFTAVPDPDDSFDRWSGVCASTAPQCTFVPQDGPTPLIATFLER